jgi:hypothetical protein
LWKKESPIEVSSKLSTFKLTPTDCLIDMKKYAGLMMKWFDDKLLELKMICRMTEITF